MLAAGDSKLPVAIDAVATAADIELRARRARTGAEDVSVARVQPALIVAGVGIVRSLVLAIGVRIELCTVAWVISLPALLAALPLSTTGTLRLPTMRISSWVFFGIACPIGAVPLCKVHGRVYVNCER